MQRPRNSVFRILLVVLVAVYACTQIAHPQQVSESVYYQVDGRTVRMVALTSRWAIGLNRSQTMGGYDVEAVETRLAGMGLSVAHQSVASGHLFLEDAYLSTETIEDLRGAPEIKSIRPWYEFPGKDWPVYLTDWIGVVFASEPSSTELEALATQHNLRSLPLTFEHLPTVVFFEWEGSLKETISETMGSLLRESGVLSVEPDFGNFVRLCGDDPNDNYWNRQWYFDADHSNFVDAWELAYNEASAPFDPISVALIDTWGPSSFGEYSVTNTYNLLDEEESSLADTSSHAAALMSIIAAKTNNSSSIAGGAGGWSGQHFVQIHLIEMIGSDYEGISLGAKQARVVSAINKAIDWQSHIINCSFGIAETSSTINSALTSAASYGGPTAQGAVIVVSSGNNGSDEMNPLASHSKVLAVGATDYYNVREGYSQYDASNGGLDLVAPAGWFDNLAFSSAPELPGGIQDVAGYPSPYRPTVGWVPTQGDYNIVLGTAGGTSNPYPQIWYSFGGTSAAAAIVSSAAALVRYAHPELSAYDVRNLLRDTAQKISGGGRYGIDSTSYGPETYSYDGNGHNDKVGFGLVRPDSALLEILSDYAGRPTDLTEEDQGTDLECTASYHCRTCELQLLRSKEGGGGEYKVLVGWTPAENESGNHHWVIERSDDGINFSPIYWTSNPPDSHEKFLDCGLEEETTYYYRVAEVVSPYIGPRSDVLSVYIESGLGLSSPQENPVEFGLQSPWPNPFNHEVLIKYGLPQEANAVRLRILNVRGQTVRILEEGSRGPGFHQVRWDGRSDAHREVASGIYLVLLEADGKTNVMKITLVK